MQIELTFLGKITVLVIDLPFVGIAENGVSLGNLLKSRLRGGDIVRILVAVPFHHELPVRFFQLGFIGGARATQNCVEVFPQEELK
jgi:hypothetical protein